MLKHYAMCMYPYAHGNKNTSVFLMDGWMDGWMELCRNEGYGCERRKDMGAMMHIYSIKHAIFLEWQPCHDSVEAAWLKALNIRYNITSKYVSLVSLIIYFFSN